MSQRIDNRSFPGVYSAIQKMLDPDGSKGVTEMAVKLRYYREDPEVCCLHGKVVKKMTRERDRRVRLGQKAMAETAMLMDSNINIKTQDAQ